MKNKDPFFYRVRPFVSEEILLDSIYSNEMEETYNDLYFDSLRSSLVFFIDVVKSLKQKKNLRVGLQVFSCKSVLQALYQTKSEVIFYDIDPGYLSSKPNEIQYKLLDILILTHTFGIPNPHYKEIADTCRQHNVILYDDLAMSYSTEINKIPTGSLSDGYSFSYGFDKPLSCYRGGKLIINNSDLQSLARERYSQLPIESDKRSQKDLKRLFYYYSLTDPLIAYPDMNFMNYYEPFLKEDEWRTHHYYHSCSNRINSKLKVLFDRGRIIPKKLGIRKKVYIEKMAVLMSTEAKKRDETARAVLSVLKTKYPDIDIPVAIGEYKTSLHRPPIVVHNIKTRLNLINNSRIQFGRYNWSHLLARDVNQYPYALSFSKSLINVPNWAPEIVNYL